METASFLLYFLLEFTRHFFYLCYPSIYNYWPLLICKRGSRNQFQHSSGNSGAHTVQLSRLIHIERKTTSHIWSVHVGRLHKETRVPGETCAHLTWTTTKIKSVTTTDHTRDLGAGSLNHSCNVWPWFTNKLDQSHRRIRAVFPQCSHSRCQTDTSLLPKSAQ